MLAFQLRSKDDLTWSIVDGAHCLACVAEQIQNYLLKLHTIAGNSWQTILEFLFQNYIVSLKVADSRAMTSLSCFIEIERLNLNLLLGEKRSQSLNHF